MPSMLSVVTEILPPGPRRAPSPIPGRSTKAPGWEPARRVPGPRGRGKPHPCPSRPSSDTSPWLISPLPASWSPKTRSLVALHTQPPGCSSAAVLGSGRLMETFIPRGSSPSPGCLSRNASRSPPALPAGTQRLHPATRLPIAATCPREQGLVWDYGKPHTCGISSSPMGFIRTCSSPPCTPNSPQQPLTGTARGLRAAEIPKLLGRFHTQAGVWGMLSCCPLGS